MKEKINCFLFLLFFFTLASTANSQNGFLSSNHSYETDENNLQLYLQAEFNIGNGICDFLDTCIVDISNNTNECPHIYLFLWAACRRASAGCVP